MLDDRRTRKKWPDNCSPSRKSSRLAKVNGVIFQGGPKNLKYVTLWVFDAFVDLEPLKAFGMRYDLSNALRNGLFKRSVLARMDANIGNFENHEKRLHWLYVHVRVSIILEGMRFSNSDHSNAFPEGVPLPSDWIRPQWPAPANVRSLCTTRTGGSSKSPFDTFNLGLHVGDSDADVLRNRALLQTTLSARPVFMQQVHGSSVLQINAQTPDGLQADASFTSHTGVACTMMVADCLPILLCDHQGTQVAAVHAGWRGLAGAHGYGVLESARGVFECKPENLLVWLGPCIGPTAFEVGEDVRIAFVADFPQSASAFKALGQGKWLADLCALARHRLSALGITQIYGNDSSQAWCTVSQPSRFFSYRRDRVCGRFAACIWLNGVSLG